MFAWPPTPYKERHEIVPAMTLEQFQAYELDRLEKWIRESASMILSGVRNGDHSPINAVLCFQRHVRAIISGRDQREDTDYYSDHLNALLEELAPQMYDQWQPGFTERYRPLGNGWFVDDHYIEPVSEQLV